MAITQGSSSSSIDRWNRTLRKVVQLVLDQLRAHAVYTRHAMPNEPIPFPEPEPKQGDESPTPFYQTFLWSYALWEKESGRMTSSDKLYVVGQEPNAQCWEEPLPSPKLTSKERRGKKLEELGLILEKVLRRESARYERREMKREMRRRQKIGR